MAVGKLLILLFISNVYADDLENPKFFEYSASGFVNNLTTMTFGWFKTLDTEQKAAYDQAVTHAIMYAENGQTVKWQRGNAGGIAVPVMTWPTSMGYCRRIHVQARAYNIDKALSATACYDNSSDNWQWHTDKY